MTKKFLFSIILGGVLIFSFSVGVVAQPRKEFVPPEEEGIYDVPGYPGLKVRVFIHREKRDKWPTFEFKCGLSDPDSEEVVDSTSWKLTENKTYNLNLASVPLSVGQNNLSQIAENASNEWERAINYKIMLTRGEDTNISKAFFDGKNVIAWGRLKTNALALTYVWYDSKTGGVKEVDTIFNLKHPWKWSGTSTCAWTNAYDVQAVLTHEFGHWFGLDDEYDEKYLNNTMYGYGFKGDAKADTLTTGDILGIKNIYP